MNWKILVTSHKDVLRVIWVGLLIGAILVLAFQIATTGWFIQSVSKPTTAVFWAGCILGFIIACLEYAMIEAFRNQWTQAGKDNKVTLGEGVLLSGIVTLALVVCFVDTIATGRGALRIGFDRNIAWIWGVGQLFAFEFLLNMAYHVRDLAKS